MITWADVKAIAPGDAAIQAFADPGGVLVTLAYARLNANFWTQPNAANPTAMLDLGARYLAAHMFTIGNKSGGSGGPTANQKVGDVAQGFKVEIKDPQWDSTPYGREFKNLLRTLQIESRWLVTGGANLPIPFAIQGPRFIP